MTHLHLISALLGGLSLGSLTLAAFTIESPPQNPAKASEPLSYTGQIGEWWVTAPGRVQFQILGSGREVKDGKVPDFWFETPADKDVNTLFENLVLDLIMHATARGLPVTVEPRNSSGDDGSVADKAFDVVRVGFGRG
jgi:hypothetical protein